MASSTVSIPHAAREAMGGRYGALWVAIAVMGALVIGAAIYGLIRSRLDADANRDAAPAYVTSDPDGSIRSFGRPNREP